MAADVIEMARERSTALNQRVQELLAEVERARVELAQLDSFVAIGLSLLSPAEPQEAAREDEKTEGTKAGERPKVLRDSYAGQAILLIRARGPLALKEIAQDLHTRKGAGAGELAAFTTSVNSALWRRKDVFGRTVGGGYCLVTDDIELVDSSEK